MYCLVTSFLFSSLFHHLFINTNNNDDNINNDLAQSIKLVKEGKLFAFSIKQFTVHFNQKKYKTQFFIFQVKCVNYNNILTVFNRLMTFSYQLQE